MYKIQYITLITAIFGLLILFATGCEPEDQQDDFIFDKLPPAPAFMEPVKPKFAKEDGERNRSNSVETIKPWEEGIDLEVWAWNVSASNLRKQIDEGSIVLWYAKNAREPSYSLTAYTHKNGSWKKVSKDVAPWNIECRVVTERWGDFYTSLPKLRSSKDQWLIAFKEQFIAKIYDVRERVGDRPFEIRLSIIDDQLVAECIESESGNILLSRTPVSENY